jgi:hypothetical protein
LDFRLSEKIAGNQSDLAALLLIGKRRFKPGGEQTLLGNFVALAANYTSPGCCSSASAGTGIDAARQRPQDAVSSMSTGMALRFWL